MPIKITSFSYSDGQPPDGADMVFDCRALPDPITVQGLKGLTGKDTQVQQWLIDMEGEAIEEALDRATIHVVMGEEVFAFGSQQGRHRGVALAERFATLLRNHGHEVEVEHAALLPR